MKIKAAVLHQSENEPPYVLNGALVVQEVDLERPEPDEVLVKIVAAGVCHSDLSVIDGVRPRPVPMVLGHEAAGIIEQIGSNVNDFQVGDHVVCIFAPSCGQCPTCSEGRPALCEPGALHNGKGDLMSGERRLSLNGVPVNHHVGVSAFAEYTTLSRHSVLKIDKDIPLHIAAMFSCAVLTGAGAVFNTAQVKPGSSVAIVGAGGVGLCALLGALAAGAGRVIVIDQQQSKLDFALELGASDVFLAGGDESVELVKEATNGGVETAIEMAGSAKALEFAYKITKRGGKTVTGGLPHPDAMLSIPAISLVAEERTLMGSYIGSCSPKRDLPRMISLWRRGLMPVEKLLTHRLPLEDINLAMDRLREGKAIRQIVDFV